MQDFYVVFHLNSNTPVVPHVNVFKSTLSDDVSIRRTIPVTRVHQTVTDFTTRRWALTIKKPIRKVEKSERRKTLRLLRIKPAELQGIERIL